MHNCCFPLIKLITLLRHNIKYGHRDPYWTNRELHLIGRVNELTQFLFAFMEKYDHLRIENLNKYLVETAKDVAFYSVFYFWSADLSNYVPKHSMDFSAWQEHKHNNSVNQEDTTTQQTQLTEEVMVRKATSVLQSNSLV